MRRLEGVGRKYKGRGRSEKYLRRGTRENGGRRQDITNGMIEDGKRRKSRVGRQELRREDRDGWRE